MIGDAYGRIRKAAEKNPLPLELSRLDEQAQELMEKTEQLLHLVEQLEALRQQKMAAAGKVEEQQEGIEHFREESGLAELDEIRREIDAIRMLVTNQLNFLKKPFKGLMQAAGKTVMVPPVAAEAADAYSTEPWQAFLDDTEGLTKLKEGLIALDDAVRARKLDFKQAIDRKISERRQEICEDGTLDQLQRRYAALATRQQDIRSAIPLEQRQALEKTLDRAQWEHRDIEADIAHTEEQVQRIGAMLGSLQQKLEKALSNLLRNPVRLEFPAEVSAIVVAR
jgi:chromosome segregation ATPase